MTWSPRKWFPKNKNEHLRAEISSWRFDTSEFRVLFSIVTILMHSHVIISIIIQTRRQLCYYYCIIIIHTSYYVYTFLSYFSLFFFYVPLEIYCIHVNNVTHYRNNNDINDKNVMHSDDWSPRDHLNGNVKKLIY